MADYTAEQYREASQGYVGPNSSTQESTHETAFSRFTTHELNAELDRRRIAKEKEFQELAREMYNLGYSYQDLDTMISEC